MQTVKKLSIVFLALLVASCAYRAVPENAEPEVHFYAAVADWNTTKALALRYVRLETTTQKERETVSEIVQSVDTFIEGVYAEIEAGSATDARLILAASSLRGLSEELRRRSR